MINIPNSTQIPNEIINDWLPKLKESELKVVIIVARQTLGWIENPITGTRKKEDWMTQKQLMKKTGLSNWAVSKATQSLVEKDLIEARDADSNILDTPKKRQLVGRHHKRIFYRLKLKSDKEILTRLVRNSHKNACEKFSHNKTNSLDKTNSIQKKTLTSNKIISSVNGKDFNDLIALFEPVNPSFERLFPNKGQRSALERLLKKHGYKKIKWILDKLPAIAKMSYAPVVTTPYQLEQKLGQIIIFLGRENNKGGGVTDARNIG